MAGREGCDRGYMSDGARMGDVCRRIIIFGYCQQLECCVPLHDAAWTYHVLYEDSMLFIHNMTMWDDYHSDM